MPIELPKVDRCIFCERIQGRRDDWAVIDEGELAIAFVNQRQFEEGQSLVIPRRHVPTVLELTDGESDALMRTVRRIARALVDAFDPDGITVYQNNGVASLQEVPHAHVHVVPRRNGAGWGEGPPHIGSLEAAARDERVKQHTAPLERQQDLAQRIAAKLPS